MRFFTAFIGTLGLVLCVGCESAWYLTRVDPSNWNAVTAIDLQTGETWRPASRALTMLPLIGTDRRTGQFFTAERSGDGVLLQRIDARGNILAAPELPLLMNRGAQPEPLAVSPNGGRVAYITSASSRHDLNFHEIQTGSERTLLENVGRAGLDDKEFRWLSERELLLCHDADVTTQERSSQAVGGTLTTNIMVTRKTGTAHEFAVIDIDSGQLRPVARGPEGSSPHRSPINYDVSPDGKTLAYVVMTWLAPRQTVSTVHVVGLAPGAADTIVAQQDGWNSGIAWGPGGTDLAFINGKKLTVHELASGRSRVLLEIPTERRVYHMVFGQGLIGYTWGPGDRWDGDIALAVIDAQTGREVRTIRAHFRGTIHMLDEGKTVVCQTGY